MKTIATLPFLLTCISAADVVLNWSIGWVKDVNPDGKFTRRAIGVNGVWPLPQVDAVLGDTIIINVKNTLDVPTAIHTHGLFQNKTFFQDGAPLITECGIAPGANYTYTIHASQTGSFWFHGHLEGQYVDGFRTPLVIKDAGPPAIAYDGEFTFAPADWYHEEHDKLIAQYLNPNNTEGDEPTPDSIILQNGPKSMSVTPGKTYRVNIISMSAFACFQVWMDGHEMSIFQVDSIHIQPYKTTGFPMGAAQRYSFTFTAKASKTNNYNLHINIDQTMLPSNATNPLLTIPIMYDQYASFAPETPMPTTLMSFDQGQLTPSEVVPVPSVDRNIVFNVTFEVYNDGINHGSFNANPYTLPTVPTGLSALTDSPLVTNPAFYGPRASAQVLNHMEGVQVVINNFDGGSHPFHLHGHVFQVLYTSQPGDGVYDASNKSISLKTNNPIRRDTTIVPAEGFAVIRFVADNPGVWVMHCHIEWHFQSGLAATFIEAPLQLQKTVGRGQLPPGYLEQCNAQRIPIMGNAAGNMDLTTFSSRLQPLTLSSPEGNDSHPVLHDVSSAQTCVAFGHLFAAMTLLSIFFF